MTGRGFRQPGLDRPCPLFAHRHLVGIAHAHDRKILRQRDQRGALRHRVGDQPPGGGEVVADPRPENIWMPAMRTADALLSCFTHFSHRS